MQAQARVTIEYRDAVAIVTLNRPEAMNAVDSAMRQALIAALDRVNADPEVRAVVIRGAGERAFCAGQDIAEAVEFTLDDIDAWLDEQHAMYQRTCGLRLRR